MTPQNVHVNIDLLKAVLFAKEILQLWLMGQIGQMDFCAKCLEGCLESPPPPDPLSTPEGRRLPPTIGGIVAK